MAAFDIADLKRRMQGAQGVLKNELAGLRTGRATPSLVEPITVEAYGSHMPLSQVARPEAGAAAILRPSPFPSRA